jgi:DNA-binding transcriptional ArsR family regulator
VSEIIPETENKQDEMLAFFKALADANRLKIVGLLANQSYSVEQLAGILNLGASTVSHHLSKLADVGLVSARAESYYNYYRLETDRLEQLSKRLLSREGLPKVEVPPDAEAFDRKVMRDYLTPDEEISCAVEICVKGL